jgi:hypothetical protein
MQHPSAGARPVLRSPVSTLPHIGLDAAARVFGGRSLRRRAPVCEIQAFEPLDPP